MERWRVGRLRWFLLWLLGFYSTWAAIVFAWMAWSERAHLGAWGLGLSIGGLLVCNAAFHVL